MATAAVSSNAHLTRPRGPARPVRSGVGARVSGGCVPTQARALAVRPTPRAGAALPHATLSSTPDGPRKVVQASAVAQEVAIEGSVLEIGSVVELEEALHGAGGALVVLDITKSNCGPCRFIFPKFVEMSEEFGEGAVFLKLIGNKTKETQDMVKEMGVKAVPEFRFFRSGELLDKLTGASEAKLRENIEAYI